MGNLYHYTSVETLYKILHNTEEEFIKLRANYYKKMNDEVECHYFANTVKEILSELNNDCIKTDESKQNVVEPYIISFSKLEDSLPMWSMYGDDGKGVAIGFSHESISEAVANYQKHRNSIITKQCFCKLYDCKYWNKDDILNEYVKKYKFNKECEKECSVNINDIHSISYLVKHPSFFYEQELRVVFLCNNNKPNYIELYVPQRAINDIVCGPCVDEDFVKSVIPKKLQSLVRRSGVPYTNR